jgi:hypothetical protein
MLDASRRQGGHTTLRRLQTLASALGGAGFAAAAMALQKARFILSGHRYGPERYSDVGGAMLEGTEGLIDMSLAAVLGYRLVARLWRRNEPGHPSPLGGWRLDAMLLALLGYLLYRANFG